MLVSGHSWALLVAMKKSYNKNDGKCKKSRVAGKPAAG